MSWRQMKQRGVLGLVLVWVQPPHCQIASPEDVHFTIDVTNGREKRLFNGGETKRKRQPD